MVVTKQDARLASMLDEDDEAPQKPDFFHARFKGTYKVPSTLHAGMYDLKPFDITVRIPKEYEQWELQSVFVRRCVRALHHKFPDAIGKPHRFELVEANWPDGKLLDNPLTFGMDNLLKWIRKNKVPIKTGLYPELKELRRMVDVFLRDPEGMKVIQAMEERLWGDDIAMQKQFDDLDISTMVVE